MNKWLLVITLLFSLLIVAIVIGADADRLPGPVDYLYHFPGGDKVGHFTLFGILSYLLNRSSLVLFPKWDARRTILTTSLLLAVLIGLEEWSQSLFPTRSMSLADLLASYAGVCTAAILAYRAKR